ncbi:DUF726-domain-containing protein [Gloeophyllum trabeum ATCC 11539]|uniref:DUF726-domain-containing protein n=1 Tax=Gloeophyllum trabeum (strain ATCC 11539 / FP-39264 / Madison 617) TaxID=670483 RepID=S7RYY2_GLOTA|nr:DUF726-domain-containing protein [Gloeophyllum trabeum ATCC 11539]EPQ60175.1 DUF726-domain-containing protein [Gloeophyllum trabeum ATCC 11539]
MPVAAHQPEPDLFDDDDEGWQDMPVVRESDEFADGLDEEDQKRYHYVPSAKKANPTGGASNATGNVLDVDDRGQEWRSKIDQNESEYTRLRLNEEDESDEVHLRTRYLFDEDKAMTPLSQMQATKNLLTEAQRIAYVGLCALTTREMAQRLKSINTKEVKPAVQSMELWALKIMGRLYYHMELETEEQKMIDSLGLHGVMPEDLVPALMTTHTVANPEYDPAEARRQAEERDRQAEPEPEHPGDDDITEADHAPPSQPTTPNPDGSTTPGTAAVKTFQTTHRVLEETSTAPLAGVTTQLSAADKDVTLDIRWTVLCDLFLIIVADSVYDARSRVLLEQVALKLGLGWLDVVKFEKRVTEALEIQEGVEKLEQKDVVEGRQKSSKKRRYMMMGLATLGGGLVIGLSAGLLAPVIGAGLGAAFTTIGISGTTGFLAGTGGAAVITTGGVLTGSGIAARGMARRTMHVRTFELLPLHNNKRVNCILTVPGFMTGPLDDPRLPFSVLDPIVGDVFSVLWEPEMIQETGSALKILTSEVLSQIGQTVLQATVMATLMTALQWPIILTKLGYLIDNPWNNALDRAKAAGSVLADVLMQRHLGVRPVTLIGFSLGARMIFYCLLELARHKAYGIVQDVFLLGTTVTASTRTWIEARSVVSGRFVNAYARNDWVLNYLFRATSGGLNTVAGLRPVMNVPGLENVDVTDKIAGHMSYRAFMPLILDQLGFPVSADYFDEPEEPDFEGERVVIREEDEAAKKKRGWFSRNKKKPPSPTQHVSRPPSAASFGTFQKKRSTDTARTSADDDLPPREGPVPEKPTSPPPPYTEKEAPSRVDEGQSTSNQAAPNLPPARAGFNFDAIKDVIGKSELKPEEVHVQQRNPFRAPLIPPPTQRSESTPLPAPHESRSPTPTPVTKLPSPPLSSEESGPPIPPKSAPRSDLTSTFQRSLSLNHAQHVSEGEGDVTSSQRSAPYMQQAFGASSSSLRLDDAPTSRPSTVPTLSFGADDGSIWNPEPNPPSDTIFGYRGFTNDASHASTFGQTGLKSQNPMSSSVSLSFGGTNGSIASLGNGTLPYATERQNPFSSSATSLTSPGLSFGSADGSIMVDPLYTASGSSPLADRDPWKSTSFNPNPWQS